MIGEILNLLTGLGPKTPSVAPDDLGIAVAALLVEAACMDNEFDQRERERIENLLASRFELTKADARKLLEAAEQVNEQSVQLYRFTRLIKDRMDPEERIRLIEMLWEVAYADGVLDPAEDQLLRRVAGLIFVTDRDRSLARQRVLARKGIAP